MAQECSCACGFSFEGGHSHHRGSANVICTHCLSRFEVRSADVFGPVSGESLELLRAEPKTKRKPRGPGRRRAGAQVVGDAARHTGVFMRCDAGAVSVEQTPCPSCHEASLAMGFADGAPCPSCKARPLHCAHLIY